MINRPLHLPPLEWIRAFEAAARCGSFTAAAAEIGITQSAVSQRISQLEKTLGAVLFIRQARAITLTVEGEAWLPHVQSALGTLHDSSEALFGSARKRLVISASQSVIALWLLPYLPALRRIAGGQLAVQTMVLGAHDAPPEEMIGIRYGTGDWPHAYRCQLFPENIAPLATPELCAQAEAWTDLPRIACAGPRPGWNTWCARFNVPTTPVPQLQFDTFAAALGAARAGMGVVLGSLPLCAEDLATGRLQQLGGEVLAHHESYWMIAGKDAVTRRQWDEICAVISAA
ncbi:LysR family transcriptional regulator [Pararhodobacter oceanensis]|uniref:LysR family transcriptional regulator n=1 Tax=Pararhodobacter oceanensis TaxID=2172121 RepID=UPI003A8E8532